ncbi:exodeoxyribonuclease VII large subunit [Nitratireductor mangrovi]|uniref:Exodeoxyribonuclease 7 large subunit n=1 Tax=Nitratireductor mangrovi TaxID=2599600 RepID=A0A6H0DX79_9HYPH|nr:exodeoxyribonuclease VII large subunit [Nitratireductor mangrovi]QIS94666.1 exodeoxyribonuclease VII large subunit [Nitratireductor mangrovi]
MNDSPTNAAEFTVSEISGALKRTVEDAFGNVRVRGEISGYRGPHSSGHAYFALKDERARLEAVIWRGTFARLKIRPEEGMEVIAQGRLTTYPGSSKYQIVIDSLEPAGAGALMALLEERRRKLAAEGLFDDQRKKRLPYLPRVIGVVTSPTGAVIRDILHRIADRYPLHVIVWPVRVQGETTGAEVASAVAGFNALPPDGAIARPDLIIVARGGGSLEDLWGFNDEDAVRAVAASDIPVISAVGHETDWTLIDHAADTRAPTPTGAAELAVPVRAELEATLASLSARLSGAVSRNGERKRQALRAAARALPSVDQLLGLPRRRFDEAASRLSRGLSVNVENKKLRLGGLRLAPATLERRLGEARRHVSRAATRLPAAHQNVLRDHRARLAAPVARLRPEPLAARLGGARDMLANAGRRADRAIAASGEGRRRTLAQATRLLETISYKSVLARGFALVTDAKGLPVKRAADLGAGDQVALQFADAAANAVIVGGDGAAERKPRKVAEKPVPAGQGSLF